MNTQITTIDYDTYDSRHGSAHQRVCIDGTITGSGKCVAYCEYEQHPGFLTEKLRSKHGCLEKGCIYYIPKTQKVKRSNPMAHIEQEHIMAISKSATHDMEGMRLMRANRDMDGGWTVYYVSIAEYIFDSITQSIEEQIGNMVRFENLGYRFEIAAELIFGIKSA